ncbi:hypothetical protein H7U18_22580 [Klebsiella pneumoniae]|uniref:Uncharacterized protein n=1 Tax=Klebsiella pneumoniae TaxID=573 RepID=A0A923EMC1_KLEPN|nr:hypothetical protein [Klebsiella pneumoniae]
MSCSLSYYIKNGALQNGIPTQGIFATDERLLDDYSGHGSSLWSLRALNIAFLVDIILVCGMLRSNFYPLK